MDICKTADGSYHLLEIGGFSFSDLYAIRTPSSRPSQKSRSSNGSGKLRDRVTFNIPD
jgi:hypothetical protein